MPAMSVRLVSGAGPLPWKTIALMSLASSGFKAYFLRLGGPLPIEPKIKRDVISIVAQGDLVVLSFVQDNKDSKGQPYKTTWFDMFRIQDGKIAEHWDSALKQ